MPNLKKKFVDCSGVVSLAEMDGQKERFLTLKKP